MSLVRSIAPVYAALLAAAAVSPIAAQTHPWPGSVHLPAHYQKRGGAGPQRAGGRRLADRRPDRSVAGLRLSPGTLSEAGGVRPDARRRQALHVDLRSDRPGPSLSDSPDPDSVQRGTLRPRRLPPVP